MRRESSARLLQAAPPPDLAALIGDFRALASHGASDADTAAVVEQICRMLRVLSQAEVEFLEQAAQGMPAEPGPSGSAFEDEDADPVGIAR
jgi:hypothetical protein